MYIHKCIFLTSVCTDACAVSPEEYACIKTRFIFYEKDSPTVDVVAFSLISFL